MRADRRLRIGAALAVAAVAASAALRATALPPEERPWPQVAAPLLVQLGLLCAAALAARRTAALTWLLVIGAAWVAAAEAIDVGLELRALGTPASTWAPAATIVTFSATAAAAIAGLYATRPGMAVGRIGRWLATAAVGWLLVACLTVVWAALDGYRGNAEFTWLDVATFPTAFWPHLVLGLAGIGLVGDLRPVAARTRARAAAADPPPGPLDILALFADELLPGRAETRRAAAEAERARLAADLHADVLPAVNRALAEAEAGGSPELLARRLREALADLEDLMVERRFVVLEAFGLVEALEWLAERVEDRTSVRVELEVADAGDGPTDPATDPGRPPPEVERAAFRIARLAVENAVLHAQPATVRLETAVAPGAVSLAIRDDGIGLPPDAADRARRDGRVGLEDMRREAESIGATLVVRTREQDDARGTSVELTWAAR